MDPFDAERTFPKPPTEASDTSVVDSGFSEDLTALSTGKKAPSLTMATGQGEGLNLRGLAILLVEDAPINQVIISRFLQAAGAQVDLAENGSIGVEMAMRGHYQVVLMDIQMPVMDGYEATRTLRARGYDVPIIAITAHAQREDREQCLLVGCSEYMTKPVDRRTLLQHVAYFAHR